MKKVEMDEKMMKSMRKDEIWMLNGWKVDNKTELDIKNCTNSRSCIECNNWCSVLLAKEDTSNLQTL